MPDPWTIIGWMLLAVVVAIPLVFLAINKILLIKAWRMQKDIRKELPRKFQTWVSLKNGTKYYINSDPNERGSVLISTDANNKGGSYFQSEQWFKMVERERLIKK